MDHGIPVSRSVDACLSAFQWCAGSADDIDMKRDVRTSETGKGLANCYALASDASGDAHICVWRRSEDPEDPETGEPLAHEYPLIQGPRALLCPTKSE